MSDMARSVREDLSQREHAAVAREVLMAALQYMRDEGFASKERDAMVRYIERVAPAPPAPETVTVGSGYQVWRFVRRDGDWQSEHGGATYSSQGTRLGSALERIASDARVIAERDARIAELERERDDMSQRHTDVCEKWSDENRRRVRLTERIAEVEEDRDSWRRVAEDITLRRNAMENERDAALRALEEKAGGEVGVTTAACGGSGVTQPESSNSGESSVAAPSSAAPSPAPRRWLVVALRDGRAMYIYEDNKIGAQLAEAAAQPEGRSVVPVVEAVATRETVERVAERMFKFFCVSLPNGWALIHDAERDYWFKFARAALTAAGFTVQEGA